MTPLEALHAETGGLDALEDDEETPSSECDARSQSCVSLRKGASRGPGLLEVLTNDVGFFLAELLRAATSPFSTSPRDWLSKDETSVSRDTSSGFSGLFPAAPSAARLDAFASERDTAFLTEVTSSGLGNGVQETLPMVSPPGVALVSWLLEDGFPFGSIFRADASGKPREHALLRFAIPF